MNKKAIEKNADMLCNHINRMLQIKNELKYAIDRHLITNSSTSKADEVGLLIKLIDSYEQYEAETFNSDKSNQLLIDEFFKKTLDGTLKQKSKIAYTSILTNKVVYNCPFHDEETPSMIVDTETKTYHCLSCGAKGSSVAIF